MLVVVVAMVEVVMLALSVAAELLVEDFGALTTVELLGQAPNVNREPADKKKGKHYKRSKKSLITKIPRMPPLLTTDILNAL